MRAYRRRETFCVVRKTTPDKPVVHEAVFDAPPNGEHVNCERADEHHPACQVCHLSFVEMQISSGAVSSTFSPR